jgi:hypothetical protein
VNVHDLVLFGHLLLFEEITLIATRRGKMKINEFALNLPYIYKLQKIFSSQL